MPQPLLVPINNYNNYQIFIFIQKIRKEKEEEDMFVKHFCAMHKLLTSLYYNHNHRGCL